MEIKNLFAAVAEALPAEVFEVLLETPDLRLERIVSDGQATPPGKWLDQENDEWVLLLRGSAGLRFADESGIRVMRPGASLRIPAHLRHRVEWTEHGAKTIWLALHSGCGEKGGAKDR